MENVYYIIMKSPTYRVMAPYSAKLLYCEYTHKSHYTSITGYISYCTSEF
jgi:hypothetical protein